MFVYPGQVMSTALIHCAQDGAEKLEAPRIAFIALTTDSAVRGRPVNKRTGEYLENEIELDGANSPEFSAPDLSGKVYTA